MKQFWTSPSFSKVTAHPQAKRIFRRAFELAGTGRLPIGSVVLDIGGGVGSAGEVLRAAHPRKLFKYVNLEVDPRLLAKKSFAERVRNSWFSPKWLKKKLQGVVQLKVKADRAQLPFASSSMDLAIYAFPAASFLPDSKPHEKLIDRHFLPLIESLRALKPGRRVIIIRRSTEEDLTTNAEMVRDFVSSLRVGKEVALEITPTPKELYKEFVRHNPGSVPSHLCVQVIEKTSSSERDESLSDIASISRKVVSRALEENEE